MPVLNDKDATTRIENVRYLRQTKDPPHAAVLNRPLYDLEERSNDVWDIMDVAKQFYVHQEAAASFSVVVEPGWSFLEEDFGTAADPTYFPGGTVTVLMSAPNKIRMDLVYYNKETNTVDVITGTEVQESTGWAGLWDEPTPLRAILPAGNTSFVPLAYLYVGSRATETFQDAALITAAGHIRDCRFGSHVHWHITGNVSEMLADTPGGSAGTQPRVSRSDHRHPNNLPPTGVTGSAAVVSQLSHNNTRQTGTSDLYAMADHKHDMLMADNVALQFEDRTTTSAGLAGSGVRLARSDHQHPLHFQTDPILKVPGDIDTNLGVWRGSGNYYARHDHRHWIQGDIFMSVSARELKWYEWNATYNKWQGQSQAKSTSSFSNRPLFAIILCCGKLYSAAVGWTNWRNNPGYLSWGWAFEGNPPSEQYCVNVQDYYNAGHDWWTAGRDPGASSSFMQPQYGYDTNDERRLICTYLGQANATFAPSNGYWHGYLSAISFGFVDISP
jgi:hypothetical protein